MIKIKKDSVLEDVSPKRMNRWYRVGDAPDGGRKEHMGPWTDEPFCFVYGMAVVMDGTGSFAESVSGAVRVDEGDWLHVEGYGPHEVVRQHGHLKLQKL